MGIHLRKIVLLIAVYVSTVSAQELKTSSGAMGEPVRTLDGLKKNVRSATSTATASLPLKMSYQGLLTTAGGTPVPDGSYDVTIALYDSLTNGSVQWSESHPGVAVGKGTFSITLGVTTPLNLQFNKPLFVQLTATGGPAGPAYPLSFSPRSELLSAPYSLAPWVTKGGDVYYAGGRVGIGSAAPPESASYSTSIRFEIADENGANSDMGMRVAGGGWPSLNLNTSRGTLETPAVTQYGDFAGSLEFRGYDGTHFVHGAGMYAWIDSTPSAGVVPTALTFGTASASKGYVERLHLDRNGNFAVDSWGYNTGSLNPGLLFGNQNSGEGISSARSASINQYGLDFYTGYVSRLSITRAGQVGIGTASPANTLSVAGGADISGNVGIGTPTPGERLTVAGSMEIGTGSGDYQHLRVGGGNSSGYLFGSYNGIVNPYGDGIHLGYNAYHNAAGSLVIPNTGGATSRISAGYGYIGLFVGGVDAEPSTVGVFVNSLGNVGIGTSAPTTKLCVAGNIAYTSYAGACSDVRYKKNITGLTSSLDNVAALRGVNYYWRTDEFPDKDFPANRQLGLIAQEVEKVYPEIVMTDDKGYKSIDYGHLTPALVEAIKELKSKNEKLEGRIATLEAMVGRLLSERQKDAATSVGVLK